MDVAVFPPCCLPSGKTGPVPPPETPGPSLASLVQSPTGHQSQISRGFSVPLPDPQVGKSAVGPRTFLQYKNFLGIIVLHFVGHLLSGSVVELMATSSKRAYATCCIIPNPPQTTTLPFCIFFLWDGFVCCFLYNISDLCP